MATSTSPRPGGFFPAQALPSPAPSISSTQSAALPHPRAKSLRPGSTKEGTVRRFIEERLAVVSRRYVKKHGEAEPGDQVVGYQSFSELCRDLHGVVDVLWLSATPSLQIPFLLKIASDFSQWIVAFSPSPRATFSMLTKLDHCFASLLAGQDADTKEPLPGFANGTRADMTTTDMVRCRSSVDQTRLLVAEFLGNGSSSHGDESDYESADDDYNVDEAGETATEKGTGHARCEMPDDRDVFNSSWEEDDDRLFMDVARVYERTIVQLGNKLGDVLGATAFASPLPSVAW